MSLQRSPKMTRAQPRRGGESSEAILERQLWVPNWNPIFELDDSRLSEDASIHNFDCGRGAYVANAVEQALLLPKDMDELWSLKKHELYLSMKRDLALVRFPYIHYFLNSIIIVLFILL